jgi:hypothetical protein
MEAVDRFGDGDAGRIARCERNGPVQQLSAVRVRIDRADPVARKG